MGNRPGGEPLDPLWSCVCAGLYHALGDAPEARPVRGKDRVHSNINIKVYEPSFCLLKRTQAKWKESSYEKRTAVAAES
jgi:hypothetical protein